MIPLRKVALPSVFTLIVSLFAQQQAVADANKTSQYLKFGAGNVATSYNPESFVCRKDHDYWVINAGVTLPANDICKTGKVTGTPLSRLPQVTGIAAQKPTATHRWWASLPFLGEMKDGFPAEGFDGGKDSLSGSAYITPDPVMARISDSGVRIVNLPAGIKTTSENNFQYANHNRDAGLFDGVTIANSQFNNLEAYMKNSSDASVTVEWQAQGEAVMEATFVHGSPYVFFKSFKGKLVVKTLHPNGAHKNTFYRNDNTLGLWTSIQGSKQHFLVVGEGKTKFSNTEGKTIGVNNASNEMTLVLLPPSDNKKPPQNTIKDFEKFARNLISDVEINYQVNPKNNQVTVSHQYLDKNANPVKTLAGLQPLHWKNLDNSGQETSIFSPYQVRSARGITKFATTDTFSYILPFIGVLPQLPSSLGSYDMARLKGYVNEFIGKGEQQWNQATDTYWAGKNYGKVAELAAIARSIGMNAEAEVLVNWLKAELEDWFSANSSGSLDSHKYFVYDQNWHTLLGIDASFGSHFMLNDHHFHYGYFVRAAAEICRVDKSWCSKEQFGPMVDLLIRDFAAGRDDELFPYLRHFDPANGFSWASGGAPYYRGNNNESTSEAANAYGAMVLYGLITKQPELVSRGTYLHASTTATYWQYWNNIDGYLSDSEELNNFPLDYKRITTSIIWGDGALFDTWFSRRYAHILGIQGLPTNPLIVHVAQYQDYMKDYVELGLAESKNRKPSGLDDGQWRDIWWSLWAMVDADAALADYKTVENYIPEQGETKAHTYHWLHTWKNLGQLKSGDGEITADHPATMVFEKDDKLIYVAYNYQSKAITVSFSDGTQLTVKPNSFATASKVKSHLSQ